MFCGPLRKILRCLWAQTSSSKYYILLFPLNLISDHNNYCYFTCILYNMYSDVIILLLQARGLLFYVNWRRTNLPWSKMHCQLTNTKTIHKLEPTPVTRCQFWTDCWIWSVWCTLIYDFIVQQTLVILWHYLMYKWIKWQCSSSNKNVLFILKLCKQPVIWFLYFVSILSSLGLSPSWEHCIGHFTLYIAL